MKTVIYLDVLLLSNFIIEFFLLELTARVSGGRLMIRRQLAGAAVAALTSIVVIFPSAPGWMQLTYQAVSCALVVWVTFGRQPKAAMAVRAIWLLLWNLLLAGLVMLWAVRQPQAKVETNNLSVYLYVSPPLLFGCVAGAYLLVQLCLFLGGKPKPKGNLAVDAEMEGIRLSLNALVDSGFNVQNPWNHRPVILVDFGAVGGMLPQRQRDFLTDWFRGKQPEQVEGCLLLPCRTATGSSILPAFAAQVGQYPVLLAFTGQPLLGANALLGTDLAAEIQSVEGGQSVCSFWGRQSN